MKYNLGSGGVPLDNHINVDRKQGGEAFPLDIPDESAELVRASHILEHFPHALVPEVIKNWVSKLKPGGVLKIAVPDFDVIAKAYLDGSEIPTEGYVMGGQTDEDDYHKALFNAATLTDHMRAAGLRDIGRWDSDVQDCAALPISLNLRGVKPAKLEHALKICAVMSMPRIGFTANFRCADSFTTHNIPLTIYEGVYWAQCLDRGLEKIVADGFDAVIVSDYDSMHSSQHVGTLIRLMLLNPHADAIVALQAARGWDSILGAIEMPDGSYGSEIPRALFDQDLVPLKHGHFGLTLIRADALKRAKRPWLKGVPADDGTWGPGKVDEDIYFWRNWRECGNTVFLAPRVSIGHLELMIKWPDRKLGALYQRVGEFWGSGPPREVWK